MKTLLIYIVFNIIVFPIYIIASITGLVGGFLQADAFGVGDLILIYAIALLPNLLLGVAIFIWGDRFQLNQKLNILCLLIIAIVLAYFIIIESAQFMNLFH